MHWARCWSASKLCCCIGAILSTPEFSPVPVERLSFIQSPAHALASSLTVCDWDWGRRLDDRVHVCVMHVWPWRFFHTSEGLLCEMRQKQNHPQNTHLCSILSRLFYRLSRFTGCHQGEHKLQSRLFYCKAEARGLDIGWTSFELDLHNNTQLDKGLSILGSLICMQIHDWRHCNGQHGIHEWLSDCHGYLKHCREKTVKM